MRHALGRSATALHPGRPPALLSSSAHLWQGRRLAVSLLAGPAVRGRACCAACTLCRSVEHCPEFDKETAVVLYPCDEAVTVEQLEPGSVRRAFVIDSRWCVCVGGAAGTGTCSLHASFCEERDRREGSTCAGAWAGGWVEPRKQRLRPALWD